jgi:hypothetical protein
MSERLREFIITGTFVAIIAVSAIFGAWLLLATMN